jgi:hypothetical protein
MNLAHNAIDDSYFAVTTLSRLADRIHRELECGEGCTVYEFELIRIWPLNEKDREAKVPVPS